MPTATVSPYDEIMEFLTSTPTPEQIIAVHPSAVHQKRVRILLDANRTGHLTTEQSKELDAFEFIERFMRRLKIHARMKVATR